MRDYVLDGTRHAKLGEDLLRSFRSQIRDFAVSFDVTSMFVFFSGGGFFNKATAYILLRIFTQNRQRRSG